MGKLLSICNALLFDLVSKIINEYDISKDYWKHGLVAENTLSLKKIRTSPPKGMFTPELPLSIWKIGFKSSVNPDYSWIIY